MAEQVAHDVVKLRKERSAVIFNCEVEELVDIESSLKRCSGSPSGGLT